MGKTRISARTACIFLALVLMAAAFSACSRQDSNNVKDSANNPVSQSESADTTSAVPETTPGVPVDLTVEVFDRGTQGQNPVDNNYWTNWIQENFGKPNNINVKFVPVARSQEIPQLNILMASNSAPDICFTYSMPTVYNYIKNNGLADLGEYIDKYGQDLKEFLGDEVLSYGLINGKQYTIPAKSTSPTPTNMEFIRKDWLDKVGLPVPQNTDELYNTLKTFKDRIPNLTGKSIIPFGVSGTGENGDGPDQDIILSFREEISEKDFYSTYGFTTYFAMPGIKEGFRYFNKLYNEGLISQDFALDKDMKVLDSDIVTGRVGVFLYNQYILFADGKNYQNLLKNEPGAEIIPFKPYADYQGKASKVRTIPVGIRTIIPKSSKRVVEAIKYLNWMADPDVLFFLQNGEEGVHYTMVDGYPKTKADIPNDKKMYVANNIDYTPIVNGVVYDTIDKVIKARSLTSTAEGFGDLFINSVMLSYQDSYVQPYFRIPIESETKYQATLTSKAAEITTQVVMAKPSDFDRLYDSLVKDLLDNGAQEIIDERKAVYDQMNK